MCAVGGDGSLNEVSRALIGSKSTMAIIPTGSGNGLARHLKIPLDIKNALEIINKGKTTTIDTIRLNDECFINVAGIGFDAHIGWKFSKYGKRGLLSYLKLIVREFPFYKHQEFELIINGKKKNQTAFLITFANGSQWGNNAYISPHSKINDGILDIVILKNVSVFNVLYLGFLLLTKGIHKSSHIELLKSKEVIIEQKNSIAHIDGEPIEVGTKIKIEVNPSSLNILIP